MADRLRQIVPEARIGIAHGQMPEHELEQVMLDFVAQRFDMLLATTIIESGLDIPNANTIFIDEADRYGLADLHQLRGRVGRYKHRAYCYLLLDPNKHLSPAAARRLQAIEEFSDMGAGFAIAMRDLEIRGAGNILGTEQSGHIAAVGYELYCELLEQAVRQLKRLPPKTVDRGRRRSARRGLHSAGLRARHAAEDRPLSPPGPDRHARGAGGLPRRAGRSLRPAAAGGRADAAGWPSCGSPPTRWQIRAIHLEDQYVGVPVRLGAADSRSWRPKAGGPFAWWTAGPPICPWTAASPRRGQSAAVSNRCCSCSDLASIIPPAP